MRLPPYLCHGYLVSSWGCGLNEDQYLRTLGPLIVRAVPIDEALEELLTERPVGDAQIERLKGLRSELGALQGELKG